MKIFVSQQNYIVGDFNYNTQKIIHDIEEAKKQGGDLVVFSELSVTAYPPTDLLEFKDFIEDCNQAIARIAEATEGIGVLVGAPSVNPVKEGKDLYNSAYFLVDKKVLQIVNKSLLPTYDIFDEYRYFEPASFWSCIEWKGEKIAVTICEDIWDLVSDPLYKVPPMEYLIREKPGLMINLSASPFSYTHAAARLNTVRKNVFRYGIPMIYCNTVGAQTETIFDGGSITLNAQGNQIQQLPYFREALGALEWTPKEGIRAINHTDIADFLYPKHMPDQLAPGLNIHRIYEALTLGIREYFSKMKFKKAVIASSGGIDSAVALAMACHALGSENVTAISMPSQFSTDHSITDAEHLSKNLGNPYKKILIKDIYGVIKDSLSPLFKKDDFDLTDENIQARIRGLLAMAYSNKFGPILLNTSNKSELAVGYGTLYGDLAGGLSILGDLYKTQVYALARYINREREIIPDNILKKQPSAELRPDQKDSDSLPDYPTLDAVLYQYIELKKPKEEMIKKGFPEELVKRILKMVNQNEYKRNQFCPILRVSPKAFGFGRKMPIVGQYKG